MDPSLLRHRVEETNTTTSAYNMMDQAIFPMLLGFELMYCSMGLNL